MFRLAALLALLVTATAILADELPQPTGDRILTVRGAISETNAAGQAVFDRAMLEALPTETFATSTIWTETVAEFTGVPLAALLDAVGAEGVRLRAVALNDYGVDIPISDAVAGGPIIAFAMDGREMSVRDKGPLWIVYPYDHSDAYRTEVIYSRSIWQLHEIEVLP